MEAHRGCAATDNVEGSAGFASTGKEAFVLVVAIAEADPFARMRIHHSANSLENGDGADADLGDVLVVAKVFHEIRAAEPIAMHIGQRPSLS